MKFNKRKIKRIRQALWIAIDSEKAFIRAYNCVYVNKYGKGVEGIRPEDRLLIAQTERTIAAFEKIIAEIDETIT